MFLSKITPKTPFKFDVGDGDLHHETVWTFFPGQNKNKRCFVFRVCQDCYYVYSTVPPIATSGKWNIDTKPFNLGSLEQGRKLIGVIRVYSTIKRNGHEYDRVTDYKHKLQASGLPISQWPSSGEIYNRALQPWFQRSAKAWGFTLENLNLQGRYTIHTRGHEFIAYDLCGDITVTDPAAFNKTIFEGIGNRKDRGCGFIMVR